MSTHHPITSSRSQPESKPADADGQTKKKGKDATALSELLAGFHATWIGEGDLNAGTNLLVARAVLLSNLSRTGCGIELPGNKRLGARANLFVGGGPSSGLVSEDVAQVALCQNHLIAQVERLFRDKIADARKQGVKGLEFPSGPRANSSENALFWLEQDDPVVALQSLTEWAKVLSFPPNPRIEDLAARPKFLVTSKRPSDLEKQLSGLHGHRPLVSLSLKDPGDAGAYAETCHALLGGPYPVGEFGETVLANLVVTDPGHVLPHVIGEDRAGWIGRMVWLVDGTTGPDADEFTLEPGRFHLSDTGGRFQEALLSVLARRLNNHDAGTPIHPLDLVPAQIRWVAYLKGMEGRLPGITVTARGLLATLAFGLIELATAPDCRRLTVTPEGVEALGRWVIERMARARMAMLETAEINEKQRLANRILGKLGDGRCSKRDLCRFLTVTAARCEAVLLALEPAGLVRRVDGNWERTHQGPLPESRMKELFIEACTR